MKVSISVFLLIILIIFAIPAQSQTTAMDFTQDDCPGDTHQLFTELDAGKVVILEFVMLNCSPCIVGTRALESIVKPYESSHPDRVRIYSFGFLNSYTCEQITAWKNDQQFSHPVFNNGEEQVDYYGGMGMPTIVVVGTNEHKVFFKSIGYLPSMDDEIIAALDSALIYNPTGISERISTDHIKIYPTVFSDYVNVEVNKEYAGADLVIFDSMGREVIKSLVPYDGAILFNTDHLHAGIYFARISGNKGISEGVRLIRQ